MSYSITIETTDEGTSVTGTSGDVPKGTCVVSGHHGDDWSSVNVAEYSADGLDQQASLYHKKQTAG